MYVFLYYILLYNSKVFLYLLTCGHEYSNILYNYRRVMVKVAKCKTFKLVKSKTGHNLMWTSALYIYTLESYSTLNLLNVGMYCAF